MPLTFAETPLYYRDSQGQYHRVLSGADMTGYRTASAQDVIDTTQDADIASRAKAADLASISVTGSTNTTGDTIEIGTYFYLNNTLVKALSDIASGATFTENTNYGVVAAGALNQVLEGFIGTFDSSLATNPTPYTTLSLLYAALPSVFNRGPGFYVFTFRCAALDNGGSHSCFYLGNAMWGSGYCITNGGVTRVLSCANGTFSIRNL